MSNFKEAYEYAIDITRVMSKDDDCYPYMKDICLALTAMEMLESLPRYDVFTNSYGCCDSQDVSIEEEVSHKGHQGYDDCEYIKVKDLLELIKEAEEKEKKDE